MSGVLLRQATSRRQSQLIFGVKRRELMSEPKLLLRNIKGEEIAFSKFGVMWRINPYMRMGEFLDSKIYDNDHKLLGVLDGESVLSQKGEVLGEVLERVEAEDVLYRIDITVDGQAVGQVFGDDQMAAAGLVLFRLELLESARD